MSSVERPKLAVIATDMQQRHKTLRRRLPKPIITVQQRSKLRLHELLSACFSASDDHFFDLAKRTHIQADQEGFFCAMRELRSKKSKVFETFFDGLERSFTTLADPDETLSPHNAFAVVNIDQLAIVGNDDLDQLVAKEAMVSRALNQYIHSIEQLAQRFDAVVPADVTVAQLPVSPARLCELFIDACRTIDINSRSFMVLFKVFERTVLQALGSMYQAMNDHLEERGILPSRTSTPTKHVPPSRNAAQAQSAGVDAPVDADFLHLDANMLVAPASSMGAYTLGVTAGMENSRAGNAATMAGSPRAAIETYNENLVKHVLTALTARKDIAAPFLPLLQQLQKPLAHIAQHDQTFFDNQDHAARRLLNMLSASALAFGKSTGDNIETDPLYAKIKAVLAKLQQNTYSDPRAINTLAEEFEQFSRHEQRRADLYEKRMLAAEQGKHKTQTARKKVLETVAEITQGLELRSGVRYIIDKAWHQVMFVTAIKYGTEGKQWDDVSQTLIDLVTSTQPYINRAERIQGLKSLLGLKVRIREGLESLFFDVFEIDDIIKQLDRTIRQFVQEKPEPKPESKKAPPVVQAPAAPIQSATADPASTPAINPAFITQAKNLGRGSWFDLTVDGGQESRCRLAAIIGNYEKYIFVQRNGSKIAEKTLDEVAQALATQALIALDSNRIFDQALEQVIAGMKRRET